MKRSVLVGVLALSACGEVVTVRSGESIQAAVDRASNRTTILVEPGIYREAVDLPRERQFRDITLRGMVVGGQRAILEGDNQRQNGIFAADIVNFTVEGFQVQNYTENGVWVGGASTDLTFRDLIVDNTGRYGIFPQGATNALVEGNKVSRVADAGVYVGQSTGRLIVQNNEVFENVAGIECENSDDCVIRNNQVHDNTGGVLIFVLPNLQRTQCVRAQVYDNVIENNNTPNFASPSDVVSNVPAGSGVTIIGADEAVIRNNMIRGNQSYAAAVVSLTLLTGNEPLGAVDPTPERNQIRDNTLANNGTQSFSFRGLTLDGGDFVYDDSSDTNCQARNGIAEPRWVLGFPLPACP